MKRLIRVVAVAGSLAVVVAAVMVGGVAVVFGARPGQGIGDVDV